ncbi:hypothetical protein H0Z60_06980 [Ectothiorhodospiraceae bacterium WFHF3C12]|nr:hypothetical protein [Ectothiorhodospiraceae bacterium WFHF3C12]
MRKLFLALILLLLSGAAALWLRGQDGYVVLVAGSWRVETSLILFAGAIAAAFILLWLALGLVMRTVRLPGGVRRWLRYRREGRARDRLINGLLAAAEGRYRDAEGLLEKAAAEPRIRLLGRILGAEVAQRAGDYARRDEYMALADEAGASRGRKDRFALRLMQADWYAEAGQWEQALATLTALRESQPNHPRVLALLRDAYLALEDWDSLAELLPALKRAGAMTDDAHAALERRVALARLGHARGEPASLQAVHEALPKSLRREPDVVLAFADAALADDRDDLAEPALRRALGRAWDESLVACYGRMGPEMADTALKHAEDWLKSRPEDPELLLAAGRLAAQRELWGRARSYLEASISRRERPDALRLLGEIQHRMGDEAAARESRQRALALALPQPL